ncbi:MAG: hypothetical protein AAFU80_14950 [Pseudomonadota bacterium]
MCMTTEALAMFLNILAFDLIETAPGQITIHADAADAVWIASDDQWCTDAPQIDRMARIDDGE